MRLPFTKYVACGNDFVLFDFRTTAFPLEPHQLIRLCNRHYGIGGDGIIITLPSLCADARMRLFNSDGSEANMCGNALRCLVHWLLTEQEHHTSLQIEVGQGRVLKGRQALNGWISVEIGAPSHCEWEILISTQDMKLPPLARVNTGVPHLVLAVQEIASFPLATTGKWLRSHPRWEPEGSNVTLVQHLRPHHLAVRTYERGIEGETLACGTGAAAAAVYTAILYHLSGSFHISTTGGETLMVEVIRQEEGIVQVVLTGIAQPVFKGEIDLILKG